MEEEEREGERGIKKQRETSLKLKWRRWDSMRNERKEHKDEERE